MNHLLEAIEKSAQRLMGKKLEAVVLVKEVKPDFYAVYLRNFQQDFCGKDGKFLEHTTKLFAKFLNCLMKFHHEAVENFVTINRNSPFFNEFSPIINRFMFYTNNQPYCLFKAETKLSGDHTNEHDLTAKFGYTVFSAGEVKMSERYWYSPERPLTVVDSSLDMSTHINLTLTNVLMQYAINWGAESPMSVFESPEVLREFPLSLDPHSLFWALRATVAALGNVTEGVKNFNAELEGRIKEFLSPPKGKAHE
jgi:hypothetical protein